MRATVPASPLAPGVSPISIHYRAVGDGAPLVILHGGWGYEIYPFDQQIRALAATHRIVIPDRTGYGGSGTLDVQRVDFHQRAAVETVALLDALQIDRAVLWGHSDGAIIALRMAIGMPERVSAVIAEATHYWRRKPQSKAFFETMRDRPDELGERVVATLAREHGERWRALISTNGAAWLQIADEARSDDADLYDGRLGEVRAPVLLIHGVRDPRTEPGECAALQHALGSAAREVCLLPAGGHSPHSERPTADEVTHLAQGFTGVGQGSTRVAQGFTRVAQGFSRVAQGFSPAGASPKRRRE